MSSLRLNAFRGTTLARRHRGTVLILVMIVLASLTALSVGLAYRTQIDVRLAQAFANRTQQYYRALGGIERVLTLLTDQELSEARVAQICRFSSTARAEGLFPDIQGDDPGAAHGLSYSLRDEQSYIHINGKFADRFEALAGRERAARILDWIDADQYPLGADGAESDFYLSRPIPHAAHDAPINALRELLFLKGVSYAAYTGEDINGNALLDDNERDGGQSAPLDNEDSRLDLGLLDLFTACGTDQLNLNTVSPAILNALGGLDDPPGTPLILSHRAGPDGVAGTEDDAIFTKPEDVTIEGLTETQLSILQDASKFCFTSNYFRIHASASSDRSAPCTLVATVRMTDEGPSMIFLERLQ